MKSEKYFWKRESNYGKNYYKRGNKWVAYYKMNKEQRYAGIFKTEEEARKVAELYKKLILEGEIKEDV